MQNPIDPEIEDEKVVAKPVKDEGEKKEGDEKEKEAKDPEAKPVPDVQEERLYVMNLSYDVTE
jgi:hypothetical protein